MILRKKNWVIGIIIFAILGIIVSGYLLKVHYSESSICDINERLSCTKVNESKYAEFLGVPVPLLGLLFYIFLLVISVTTYFYHNQKIKFNFNYIYHPFVFLILTIPALIFSLYLTYIEFFIINIICMMCLVSMGIVIILNFMGYKYYKA